MNILLDYVFKINAIDPVPAASTAFLKQVLLVVKPKVGVSKTIRRCTTMIEVAALTDNTEAQSAFNGGLTRVYILPTPDLDLADVLSTDPMARDFYTILISSDFSDDEIKTVVESPAQSATVKIQDILYTAKPGDAGNDISIEYVDGATATEESVNVVGNVITVSIDDGVSIAEDIASAVLASGPAMALLDAVEVDEGDESDPQSVDEGELTGGADEVLASGGMDLGPFEGVVGISTTDDVFAKAEAAKKHRVGFHTTTSTKAKNMIFAFAKLLSATFWRNQQYIEMPHVDDVDSEGKAELLFDDRISFVMNDPQYGNRLGFFASGGAAIAAPYILKNYVIDLQSKALQYIVANQPEYTVSKAALLEDELGKVTKTYLEVTKLLDQAGVTIRLINDNFVATAFIDVKSPRALWKLVGELRQS